MHSWEDWQLSLMFEHFTVTMWALNSLEMALPITLIRLMDLKDCCCCLSSLALHTPECFIPANFLSLEKYPKHTLFLHFGFMLDLETILHLFTFKTWWSLDVFRLFHVTVCLRYNDRNNIVVSRFPVETGCWVLFAWKLHLLLFQVLMCDGFKTKVYLI